MYKYYKYIALFIIVTLFSLVLNYLKNEDEREFLKTFDRELEKNYRSAMEQYSLIASLFYKNYETKASEIFKDAKVATGEVANRVRERLLDEFINFYEANRDLGLKQFHFHLPNGDSFLRFHRKAKFGDNLFEYRYSVKLANQKYLYMNGFEEGRIFNGFRNVYPLFYNGEHIGSFEISFGFDALRDAMEKISKNYFTMVLKRDIVQNSLFKRELKNYRECFLSDKFMFESSTHIIKRESIKEINRALRVKNIDRKMDKFKHFSEIVNLDGRNHIVSFFPLNDIQNRKVGYIVSYSQDIGELNFLKEYTIYYILGLLIIFALFYIFEISIKHRAYIEQILNHQRDLIFLTDGDEIEFANLSFLNFFSYKTLKEFKAKHKCVCEFFQEDRNYLYNGKDGKKWIDIILNNLEIDYRVKMFDRVFSVSLKEINRKYIVSLRDITSIEQEKILKDELLIEQSKMAQMGEMIGAIAHQWKQPLNSISLISQDIVFNLEDNEVKVEVIDEVDSSVNSIMSQIDFMNHTINDFRNFLNPAKKEVNFSLKRAIEDILRILSHQLKNSYIEVNLFKDEALNDNIKGYPNEFKQVILNILNNSKDAIEDLRERGVFERNRKGEIDISILKYENNSLSVKIVDNGGGISEDILNSIFNPYFTTKGEKGTGIGLYICKKIIEKNMGGTLRVNNRNFGVEFEIIL